jgi:hypothetical protein
MLRAGRHVDATAVICAALDRFEERAQVAFAEWLGSLRRDGLLAELPGGGLAVLAHAVARF